MSYLSQFTASSTPSDVWATQPDVEKTWPVLPGNILNADSELTKEQRAFLAAYYASLYSASRYEGSNYGSYALGNMFGEEVTVDETLLAAVIESPEDSRVDERLVPILRYVRKLCLESYKLLPRDVEPIFAAGWSEETLSDIAFLCAATSFYFSVMLNHGIELNQGAAQ